MTKLKLHQVQKLRTVQERLADVLVVVYLMSLVRHKILTLQHIQLIILPQMSEILMIKPTVLKPRLLLHRVFGKNAVDQCQR